MSRSRVDELKRTMIAEIKEAVRAGKRLTANVRFEEDTDSDYGPNTARVERLELTPARCKECGGEVGRGDGRTVHLIEPEPDEEETAPRRRDIEADVDHAPEPDEEGRVLLFCCDYVIDPGDQAVPAGDPFKLDESEAADQLTADDLEFILEALSG